MYINTLEQYISLSSVWCFISVYSTDDYIIKSDYNWNLKCSEHIPSTVPKHTKFTTTTNSTDVQYQPCHRRPACSLGCFLLQVILYFFGIHSFRNANVRFGALVTDGKGEWSLSTILGHNEPDAQVAKGWAWNSSQVGNKALQRKSYYEPGTTRTHSPSGLLNANHA